MARPASRNDASRLCGSRPAGPLPHRLLQTSRRQAATGRAAPSGWQGSDASRSGLEDTPTRAALFRAPCPNIRTSKCPNVGTPGITRPALLPGVVSLAGLHVEVFLLRSQCDAVITAA